MEETETASKKFPIGIGEAFGAGWDGYKAHFVAISLAAAPTWIVLVAAQIIGTGVENPWTSFFVQLLGVVLASTVALPWYRAALAAVDGTELSLRVGSTDVPRFRVLFGSSIYFWAAILLGLRYLNGIPALLVLVFYAFYGFVVADTERGVLMSLSYSVFLGQGRRIGVFAIGMMLIMINFLAFLPIGTGITPATQGLTLVLLVISTSFSMVCGAAVYRALDETSEGAK